MSSCFVSLSLFLFLFSLPLSHGDLSLSHFFLSLSSVYLTDFYIALVASGAIHDLRFVG